VQLVAEILLLQPPDVVARELYRECGNRIFNLLRMCGPKDRSRYLGLAK
jgi:hypothetical protein